MSRLTEAIENTYIVFNEGLCEELDICKDCIENRDKLHEVMVMLEDIDCGATITDSVSDHFIAYSMEIDEMIARIESILKGM